MTHTLLNEEDYLAIKKRIESLTPQNKALWGKMTVLKMVKHLYVTQEIALGERQASKSNFILKIFGTIYRKKYTKDNAPFGKNSPTDKVLLIAETGNFDSEKATLLQTYNRFCQQLQANKLVAKHNFFQEMSQHDWGILQYKHLDHHLRQFGA